MNCPQCEKEEIDRATACMAAEDAADAKGEQYKCPCPPRPECTHTAADPPRLRFVAGENILAGANVGTKPDDLNAFLDGTFPEGVSVEDGAREYLAK